MYDEEAMVVKLAHGAHLVVLEDGSKSALDVLFWGCVPLCVELGHLAGAAQGGWTGRH